MFIKILLLVAFFLSLPAFSLNITHHAPAGVAPNESYELLFLKHVLNATREEYGNAILTPSPVITQSRAIAAMKKGKYENFIRALAYQGNSANNDLTYIPYPVNRGSFGYRICFYKTDKKYNIQTRNDLLQYSYGQGFGWPDVKILRYNGFKVYEGPEYTLHRMLSYGRIDFFCRGITEARDELLRYGNKLNISLDHSFLIYYPQPVFFYTNSNNRELIQRIQEGIRISIANDSLNRLWESFFQVRLNHVRLHNRKVFKLENPYLPNIDKSYQQHVITFR